MCAIFGAITPKTTHVREARTAAEAGAALPSLRDDLQRHRIAFGD